jgi:hypothetical protein
VIFYSYESNSKKCMKIYWIGTCGIQIVLVNLRS